MLSTITSDTGLGSVWKVLCQARSKGSPLSVSSSVWLVHASFLQSPLPFSLSAIGILSLPIVLEFMCGIILGQGQNGSKI